MRVNGLSFVEKKFTIMTLLSRFALQGGIEKTGKSGCVEKMCRRSYSGHKSILYSKFIIFNGESWISKSLKGRKDTAKHEAADLYSSLA